VTSWLIDKSALVRLAASPDAADWAARIERGLVRIATVTRLEIGYSARSGSDLRTGLRQPPLSSMPVEYLTPRSRTVRSKSWRYWPTRACIVPPRVSCL
jgi:predicted nucleic acid-binding protein